MYHFIFDICIAEASKNICVQPYAHEIAMLILATLCFGSKAEHKKQKTHQLNGLRNKTFSLAAENLIVMLAHNRKSFRGIFV